MTRLGAATPPCRLHTLTLPITNHASAPINKLPYIKLVDTLSLKTKPIALFKNSEHAAAHGGNVF
jgi:hypothetical protein